MKMETFHKKSILNLLWHLDDMLSVIHTYVQLITYLCTCIIPTRDEFKRNQPDKKYVCLQLWGGKFRMHLELRQKQ